MRHAATFIIFLPLVACSKPQTGPDPRERVLQSWWEDFLGPELQGLGTETGALSERVGEFCATLSDSSLDAARSQWALGHAAVKRQEIFAFGPYTEEPLRFKTRLDFWPARPETIEATVADETISLDAIATLPGPARGFPAMEYLLYETALEDWTPRRCDYLKALADDAHTQSLALHEAWNPAMDGHYNELLNPGNGGDFESLVLAVSAVINRLWFSVENIHAMKLADPLSTAAEGGTAQPDLAEARFAPRSLDAIRDNLDAVEHLYFGTDGATGIAEFMPTVDQPINDDIAAALDDARAALEAITVPLPQAVESEPENVQAAIDAMIELQKLIEVDAISALGLSLSFNDNDGD